MAKEQTNIITEHAWGFLEETFRTVLHFSVLQEGWYGQTLFRCLKTSLKS